MTDTTPEEDQQRQRDDIRCDAALQTLEDVLWRFNESSEGTLSVYDLMGFLVEDLVREGFCPACVNEAMAAGLARSGGDPKVHRNDDGELVVRGPDDVFH
ncbi:MAG: hypothetical protein R3E82_07555 [Pseudomonadales bacterium]|nr:hypothetical protein [Pseudomonadales bacterium]